jgi:predicted NUDIX family phosphoesterase
MDNHKAEEEIEIKQIINKMMLKDQEVIEVTEEIGKKTTTKQEDPTIMGIGTIMTEEDRGGRGGRGRGWILRRKIRRF